MMIEGWLIRVYKLGSVVKDILLMMSLRARVKKEEEVIDYRSISDEMLVLPR